MLLKLFCSHVSYCMLYLISQPENWHLKITIHCVSKMLRILTDFVIQPMILILFMHLRVISRRRNSVFYLIVYACVCDHIL